MWRILHGKSELLLPELEPDSLDSCVTDPPYGYAFMARAWDSPDNVAFRPETWRLVLRALKPGAHLLAFGGTRTFHRLTCAIEDAGFEVRDCLMWLYGQGMPKSHDVSKAIDKAAGVAPLAIGPAAGCGLMKPDGDWNACHNRHVMPAPATPEAKQWDGWGTALSPSWEPIVLARKPLSGTVAANVMEHGTGGLNIDGCRLAGGKRVPGSVPKAPNKIYGAPPVKDGTNPGADPTIGRWPPNVALDEEAAAAVDRQSGERPTHARPGSAIQRGADSFGYNGGWRAQRGHVPDVVTGGASRFFYCPKASTAERNAGLGDEQNPHPTVKPLALMRWLCRLITPPGGLVLDPFCGSGSTGVAAVLEGFRFLGLEQDAEAVRVARLRIHHRQPNSAEVADVVSPAAKQGSLF